MSASTAAVFLFLLGFGAAAIAETNISREWRPEDIARFAPVVIGQNQPTVLQATADQDKAFVHSPDGHYVFVVENWPDLEDDANVTQLSVYRIDDLMKALGGGDLQPWRMVRAASRRELDWQGGINKPAWDQESRSIVYLTETAQGQRQISRLDVETGVVEVLTEPGAFLGSEPDWFLYRSGTVVWQVTELGPRREITYPMEPIVRQKDDRLKPLEIDREQKRRVFWRIQGGPVQTYPEGGTLVLSPDGQRALHTVFQVKTSKSNAIQVEQESFILDLRLGRRLGAVAYKPARSIVPSGLTWAAGGDPVLFSTEEAGHPAIVAIDSEADSRQTLAVLDAQIAGARWLPGNSKLLVKLKDGTGILWEKNDGHWSSRPARPEEITEHKPGITLSIRQSANTSPIIIATDGQREVRLRTGSPTLDGIKFAVTEEFQWMSTGGKPETGLLTRPARDPKRAPLVIQVNPDFNAKVSAALFLPEGYTSGSPYAVQSLAARGFAVLQIGGKERETKRDGAAFVDRIDRAVDALTQAELIDPTRVGLSARAGGGCTEIEFALTHPGKVRIAAAILHDPSTASFINAVVATGATGADVQRQMVMDRFDGNFWQNRASWLERETIFNLDHVQAATLYSFPWGGESGDPYDSLQVKQIVGGFRWVRRPLECLVFPKGDVVLSRPSERLALTTAVLDWFSFWLKDEAPADPKRAERWALMKANWQAQQAWEAAGNPVGSKPNPQGPKERATGLTAADVIKEMTAAGVASPGRNPWKLNRLGYIALYGKVNGTSDALRYFKWNVALFATNPNYPDLLDSLAEGYLQAGDRDNAIKIYEQVLALKANFRTDAAKIVAELTATPENLSRVRGVQHARSSIDLRQREPEAVSYARFRAAVKELNTLSPQDAILPNSMLMLFSMEDLKVAAGKDASWQDFTGTTNETVKFLAEARRLLCSQLGKPLEMKFTAIDGREVDVSRLRGKVVLVDFWATWCGPCVKEMPNVVAAYEKLHEQGFEVVGVTLDHDNKPAEEIKKFTQDHQMSWPQCFDAKRGDQAFAKKYGIEAIPAMFLLDKNGMMVSTTNARGPSLVDDVRKLLGLPSEQASSAK